jgi:hypothetical protein
VPSLIDVSRPRPFAAGYTPTTRAAAKSSNSIFVLLVAGMNLAVNAAHLPHIRETRCSQCGPTEGGVPHQTHRHHLPTLMPIDKAAQNRLTGVCTGCCNFADHPSAPPVSELTSHTEDPLARYVGPRERLHDSIDPTAFHGKAIGQAENGDSWSSGPADSCRRDLLSCGNHHHFDWRRRTNQHGPMGDWLNAVLVGDAAQACMASRGRQRCRSRRTSQSCRLGLRSFVNPPQAGNMRQATSRASGVSGSQIRNS